MIPEDLGVLAGAELAVFFDLVARMMMDDRAPRVCCRESTSVQNEPGPASLPWLTPCPNERDDPRPKEGACRQLWAASIRRDRAGAVKRARVGVTNPDDARGLVAVATARRHMVAVAQEKDV